MSTADFNALVADVYSLTGRPDLVAETAIAVKSATLKAHQYDFYDRDIVETGIQFNAAAILQSLEYKELLPRWRALKYLRKYEPIGDTPGDFFEIIPVEKVLDSYKVTRENVAYLAGLVIQIRSSEELQYCLLGAYVNPDITVATFSSWIAQDHPYAIVYEAAATIFDIIEYSTAAAKHRGLAEIERMNVTKSNLQLVGY